MMDIVSGKTLCQEGSAGKGRKHCHGAPSNKQKTDTNRKLVIFMGPSIKEQGSKLGNEFRFGRRRYLKA